MFNKKVTLMLALLVLAVFAIGSVSASDYIATDSDVSVDDIVVDEVSTDDVVENNQITYNVDSSMTNDEINDAVSRTPENTRATVNYAFGTYYNVSIALQSNTIYEGNGATLVGDGTHDIFSGNNVNNFTIRNFIIDVNGARHGIYGHHIYNSTITNNTIVNCEDAINIYQIHENLTITDNTIYNFTGDGISLVNFQDYSTEDDGLVNFVGSIVSRNKISGGAYGMFFGGNFKGEISDNNISGSNVGIEFKGKKSGHNGQLNATISGNNITGASTGINMFNPGVKYLNFTHNNVYVADSTYDYAIDINENFTATANAIHVTYCNFTGFISFDFYYATYDEHDNDGFYNLGI